MALETGLRSLLLAQPGITALAPAQLIGGTTYQGVFNEDPGQGFKPPYILISLIDYEPYVCLDGTVGMKSYEIDIDCYAYRFDKSVELSDAMQAFLNDYTGPAGVGNSIKAVILLSKRHDKLFEDQGRDVREHIDSLSYQIQAT